MHKNVMQMTIVSIICWFWVAQIKIRLVGPGRQSHGIILTEPSESISYINFIFFYNSIDEIFD